MPGCRGRPGVTCCGLSLFSAETCPETWGRVAELIGGRAILVRCEGRIRVRLAAVAVSRLSAHEVDISQDTAALKEPWPGFEFLFRVVFHSLGCRARCSGLFWEEISPGNLLYIHVGFWKQSASELCNSPACRLLVLS